MAVWLWLYVNLPASLPLISPKLRWALQEDAATIRQANENPNHAASRIQPTRDKELNRMHKIIPEKGNLVRVEVSGQLTQDDYDALVPSWRATIARHGTMRMLFVMRDFEGWTPQAAWEDFRFDLKHHQQVERIAMVGEKQWQHWMTKIASWFVDPEVRYFDATQENEAESWVREK